MGRHVPEFPDRGQPREVTTKFSEISYREFPSFFTLLSKFSVEWFAFQKLNNFRIFGKLSVPFALSFFNFSHFFVEWKAPILFCSDKFARE